MGSHANGFGCIINQSGAFRFDGVRNCKTMGFQSSKIIPAKTQTYDGLAEFGYVGYEASSGSKFEGVQVDRDVARAIFGPRVSF